MKLFLCWSGDLSGRVARVLRDWIPAVVPCVETYASMEDLEKGVLWVPELRRELLQTAYGIVCVVPGNDRSPWLAFEAGALSVSVGGARVAPFLVGLGVSELAGPLAAFQATVLEREDVLRLVRSINAACGPTALPAHRLERAFDARWPGLAAALGPLEREARAFAAPRRESA
jgi:hypothetical protein